MATYTLPTPSFNQEPYFSWVFHTPIVAGLFFVFKTSKGKLQVARILEATKALLKGYNVKANLFIPLMNGRSQFAILWPTDWVKT
jgi:hypothetical protein